MASAYEPISNSYFLREKMSLQVKKQLLPLSKKIKFSLQIWIKYEMILVLLGQRKSEKMNKLLIDYAPNLYGKQDFHF